MGSSGSVLVKAAVLHEIGKPLVVEEIELDAPRAGEVRVRLAASGVCRSDWHMIQGVHPPPLPIVLGHEGAGWIEEVGPGVDHVQPGDAVVLTWLPHCGRCVQCRYGRPTQCSEVAWSDRGLMRDGTTRLHRGELRIHHNSSSTFAEQTVVPAETAIALDASIDVREAALLGCAVMTGVGAVRRTARVASGRSVAVVGCGGVGLSAVKGAVIAGASPIVALDVVRAKLELAQRMGATHTVDASDPDVLERVRAIAPDGADYVFEALGDAATLDLAVQLTARGGMAVLVGLAAPDTRLAVDPLGLVFEERSIVGCMYGSCVPERDYPELFDLLCSGRLQLGDLVDTTCELDGINEAFARMARGEGARTVIVYPDD
jgi:Zn-dependent alcohol dehydrogenase